METPSNPGGARSGQFTTANAAYYGKRGAAERERRFLARFPSVQTEKRNQKARLRAAKHALTAAARRSAAHGRPIDSWGDRAFRDALTTLEELLDSRHQDVQVSAALAVLDWMWGRTR
jgi:hypothetical protein